MNRLAWLWLIALLAGGEFVCAAEGPFLPAAQAPGSYYQDAVTPLPRVAPVDSSANPYAVFAAPAPYAQPAPYTPYPASTPSATPIASDFYNGLPPALKGTKLVESSWYTRLDYYIWHERVGGQPFMKENGLLPALGYVRRSGAERFRGELFGNKVHYGADIEFNDGFVANLSSETMYVGLRGEYEYLFEPKRSPRISPFIGLGSRFWIRNFPDTLVDPQHMVLGYQETWWTFYPYIGVERRHTQAEALEFYYRGRAGLIAFTYEHVTLDDTILFPRQGFTAQAEAGVRGPRLFAAANFEAMQWERSATVRGAYQPRSQMFLIGLRTGVTF